MREGGLDAPTRHVIPWEDPDFFDRVKTEAEMRRIFDICHGCRRCFSLCHTFPTLFEAIDATTSGELHAVPGCNRRECVSGFDGVGAPCRC